MYLQGRDGDCCLGAKDGEACFTPGRDMRVLACCGFPRVRGCNATVDMRKHDVIRRLKSRLGVGIGLGRESSCLLGEQEGTNDAACERKRYLHGLIDWEFPLLSALDRVDLSNVAEKVLKNVDFVAGVVQDLPLLSAQKDRIFVGSSGPHHSSRSCFLAPWDGEVLGRLSHCPN